MNPDPQKRVTDWMVRREWRQVTLGDGLYEWSLAFDQGSGVEFVNGHAFSRLGVRWQVFKALRRANAKTPWRAFWKPAHSDPADVARSEKANP